MKYLAIDLGSKTLGLAKGAGIIAAPWKTLIFKENDFQEALEKIMKVIEEEYQADKIILGLPLNMDGSSGDSAQVVLNFKKLLENNVNNKTSIILIDERRTTFSANQVLISANLSRKKRKKLKDEIAAAIILQIYFDKLNFKKNHEGKEHEKS